MDTWRQGLMLPVCAFQLLFQADNPGITFEYTVPTGNNTDMRRREFFWKYMDWTHCTSSCGGGERLMPPYH